MGHDEALGYALLDLGIPLEHGRDSAMNGGRPRRNLRTFRAHHVEARNGRFYIVVR